MLLLSTAKSTVPLMYSAISAMYVQLYFPSALIMIPHHNPLHAQCN